jgi:carbonic anhydrase
MGTIEYAVKRLAVPLLLVLGHSKCGAVAAAVEGHVPQGRLQRLLQPMAPLVTEAKARGGDVLDHAVRANVRRVVQSLCNEDSLSVLVKGGMLKIAGAHYDLETGVVTLVP